MSVPETSIVRATWLALLAPKRLVPIVVVCIPLVFTQAAFSREPLATPLGIVLCLAFVALAPVSYRVLFPDGLDLSHGAVRLVLYALVGAGVVLSLGVGVPKLLQMRATFLTDRASLAVIIAMFLVGGWGLGRDIGFEQRVTRLQAEAERAHLLALRAHLDPHFLFNTLNAIAEWCRIDGVVAEAAVLKLSQMLRAVLAGVKEPLWPLEKELELVHMLFDLHLLRDKELFTLEVTVPSPVPSVRVPPMSVLTLAENAVKHGPAKGHRGLVQLSVAATADGVVIAVENPGTYGGPRAGSDGLPTLEKQLALATNGRARFSIGPAGDARTRATLTFPGATG
jgi:two-component system, LytTR family, sensor histidine kinase AlgZ